MSTQPSEWQNPKTNWTSADVPTSDDFRRIEGNTAAVETGQRTLDLTQIPTSNKGTLREILDWFANRIKGIVGTANWYDAPPATLQSLCARKIIAGGGLTGGGDLSADRTLALGTPGSITATTTNSVTEDSHTHALSGIAQMATGTYTGNAESNRTISVGFTPKSVTIVRNSDASSAGTAMAALVLSTDGGLVMRLIDGTTNRQPFVWSSSVKLTTTGFSISSVLNSSDVVFAWTAFA